MKKIISLVLVMILVLGTFSPVMAKAISVENKLEKAIRELEELKTEEHPEELHKLEIRALKEAEKLRFNPDTIYDLDSIPARIELLVRLVRAMRFATTELVNKIDSAHVKIAEYITVGLLQVANPFATVTDLMVYAEEFDYLENELLAYPDLGPNDTANLYKRTALDRKLHEARFMRHNLLKDASREVVRNLEKTAHEVTKIRLRPRTTVAELEKAERTLDAAIAQALSANSPSATSKEIRDLRKLVWDARGEIINAGFTGKDVEALKEAHDEASSLVLQIRPAQDDILRMIKALKLLLGN